MSRIRRLTSSQGPAQSIRNTNQTILPLTPFDERHYLKLIEARRETIRYVVTKLVSSLPLINALDVGCGVGFFAQALADRGLNVCGFDARGPNVAEARKRFPQIPFEQADIQNPAVCELGRFDLVLCFGLLYHLENPLLAIRNLRRLTQKCLLLESMCVRGISVPAAA